MNNKGQSVVDYILCSPGAFNSISDFTVLPMTEFSDHAPLEFSLKIGNVVSRDMCKSGPKYQKMIWVPE